MSILSTISLLLIMCIIRIISILTLITLITVVVIVMMIIGSIVAFVGEGSGCASGCLVWGCGLWVVKGSILMKRSKGAGDSAFQCLGLRGSRCRTNSPLETPAETHCVALDATCHRCGRSAPFSHPAGKPKPKSRCRDLL